MTEPVRSTPASPVRLEHDLCVLELPADFHAVPSLDEYQFSFESPSRKASVVLSILPVDIPPTGLQAFAEIFVLTRKAAEMEGRSNCRLDEEESRLFDDSMAHVMYACTDDTSVSRFLGWATDRKFVSLWVGMEGSEMEACAHLANEVFDGLRL
ncbi:hypothetical protein [Brevundimonas kwangchunensis]|uniref:hypothetical protein n=1 Tax=Brevundimonas kwangchunensis TaxID=322163 RepID=UPI0031DFB264